MKLTPNAKRSAPRVRKTPQPRTLIEPPTFSPGVELHRPLTEGDAWFLRRGTHQYFRLTDDLARLAGLIDGSRSRERILHELDEPWTEPDVDLALQSLGDAQVLRAEGEKTRSRRDIIRFVPPFTVQLTLFNPSRLLQLLASWTSFARTRASVIVASTIIFCGIVALAAQPAEIISALSSPVPYATVLAILLGTLASTALHEFGHGLVLASYGGRPRRIGVMLFYLMPAFFCDVSDGWRLSHSRQRVHVALAGILVQGTIGAAAALATLLPVSANVRNGLLIFAVVSLLACLMNTIPFVKLDGYIALMSWVDIPHLRDKAIADARGVLGLVLFGRRLPRRLPQVSWAVPFGFACLLFPAFLVTNALLIWFDTLQRLGIIGSLMILMLITVAMLGLGKEIAKTVSETNGAGASRTRLAIVATLVAAVTATTLAVVPVPQSMAGGFVRTPESAELILPTSIDPSRIKPGTPVELRTSGIVLSTSIGQALVADGPPMEKLQPFSSLFPVQERLPLIPTITLPLADATTGGEQQGAAFIRLDDQPLWQWLFSRVTDYL